jgi:hypothetical protein
VLGHEDEGVTKDHYPVGRVHQLEEPTCSSTIEHAQIAATVLPLVNFATSLAKESLKIKMPSKQKINCKKVEAACMIARQFLMG